VTAVSGDEYVTFFKEKLDNKFISLFLAIIPSLCALFAALAAARVHQECALGSSE
jgi:hypothetical protein